MKCNYSLHTEEVAKGWWHQFWWFYFLKGTESMEFDTFTLCYLSRRPLVVYLQVLDGWGYAGELFQCLITGNAIVVGWMAAVD